MNQACDGAFASSAVPVLPAIGMLAPCSTRPVPLTTTARMYPANSDANSGVSIDTGSSTRLLLSSIIQRPCGIFPLLATVAATRAIWNGLATTWPWP